MERKRKLPARAARVESVSKKRTSTPPEPRTQPTPPPAASVEEPLPKSVVAGKPLPTLDEPQADNLSAKDFQTISESGVLAESLQRSRARWLSEGIFERYWTKPTAKNKKNGGVELPNNPPKDSMTKLGTCTITCEPHIFEASMFAIKDPHPKTPITSTPPQPMYRPIIQYGPPNGAMPPPPAPPPLVQKPVPPPQPIQKAPPKAEDTPMTNSDIPSPAPTNTNAPTPPQPPNGAIVNGQAAGAQAPTAQQQNPAQPAQPANNAPPAAPAKSTDPVIQMLAERAATDPGLKALMRIVANGEASPEELKKFQTHIDELSRIQKQRQAVSQPPPPPQTQPSPPAPSPKPANVATPAPPTQVNGKANVKQSPKPSPKSTPAQSPAPVARAAPLPPQPPYQPQPQALRSKGPLPATKPDICGVVFEFTGGSGDRFLFPKFSILEYLPQGQVIASFLIVRKGSASDSPTYDPELDYYQPITIRLYAHQGRQLDALQKVVAPQEEVRRYMDDIMDNMTRAEYVLLAMRLPKDDADKAAAEKEKEEEAERERAAQMDSQALWVTTHPTPAPPAQMKPAPRLLTEEEKYQSFIATVS